jgi:hypothetical protein
VEQPDSEPPALEDLPGSRVLLGITVKRHDEVVDLRQLVGRVREVDAVRGICIALDGGGEYWLPPAPEGLEPAEAGTYNLHNGDTVVDPDYVSTWTVGLAEGQAFPERGYEPPPS